MKRRMLLGGAALLPLAGCAASSPSAETIQQALNYAGTLIAGVNAIASGLVGLVPSGVLSTINSWAGKAASYLPDISAVASLAAGATSIGQLMAAASTALGIIGQVANLPATLNQALQAARQVLALLGALGGATGQAVVNANFSERIASARALADPVGWLKTFARGGA